MTAAPGPQQPDEVEELLDRLADDGITVRQLAEVAGRRNDYCCPLGCGNGACEDCPCCAAGWCVAGVDGLPEDPDDRARWVEVAAQHNPIVAALREAEARPAAPSAQPDEPCICGVRPHLPGCPADRQQPCPECGWGSHGCDCSTPAQPVRDTEEGRR